MLFIIKAVHWVFTIYTLFILARIIGSWFPQFTGHPLMRFVRFYADPYLNIFRRLIPPIGGVLDLSPILAFLGLQMLEKITMKLLLW